MPRTFFGISLHQVAGGGLMLVAGLNVLHALSNMPRDFDTEVGTSQWLSTRFHLVTSLLELGLGYTLQAHNPSADRLFNQLYNQTAGQLLNLFQRHPREVDEINIIRDDIDGIERPPRDYRLR